MKTLVRIIPIIILFAACGKPSGNYEKLVSQRDSLQTVLHNTTLDIQKLDLEIAELDTTVHEKDKKIMKRIINEKTRIANIEKTIRGLENKLKGKDPDANNIAVAVKEMKLEPFNHYFFVFGNTEAVKYGNLSPEMGGKIETIFVSEGQEVKKGDLLVSLNTDAIKQQIEGVKSNLDFATKNYEKQKNLWDQQIGSEIQFLQAKSAKEGLEAQLEALSAQLRMSQLRAPFDGIVNKINAKKGEIAGPQFPVVEFVNLSSIRIKAEVSEKYVGTVKKGQNVELSFDYMPDLKITTPIVRVSKVLNPKSRTFEIELNIDNKGELIKPNMVSTILINDYSANEALVIPSLVIKKDIAGDYVYVAVEKDNKTIVEKRPIEIGMSYQDQTMITNGLSIGDKVIVKGYNVVSTGIPVSVK